MRRALVVAALACTLPGLALAGAERAVAMRDGPANSGRFVGPIWTKSCPDGQHLVGLRIHKDKAYAGIDLICAGLSSNGADAEWTSKPRIVGALETRPSEDGYVTYVNDNGMVAPDPYDSYYGYAPSSRQLFRNGEADRIVIAPETPLAPQPARWESDTTAPTLVPASYSEDIGYSPINDVEAYMQGIDEPSAYELKYAQDAYQDTPFVWRFDGRTYRGAVALKDVTRSQDVACPAASVVTGLRTGWKGQSGRGQLAAIQLRCGDGAGREVATVGDWPRFDAAPAKGKGKRNKAAGKKKAPALRVEQTDCRGSSSNPHDGQVVQTIFGTVDEGRVHTIGISCARTAPSGGGGPGLTSALLPGGP